MKKRILSILMSLLMVLTIIPQTAFTVAADDTAVTYPGYAYVSLSDDGKFVVSDGEISDVPIAHLKIALQDIAQVDLSKWDLEEYSYTDYDTGEPDPDAPTVLKMYLYLLDHYYGSAGDGRALTVSGAPHSIFMEHFWGHDCNLLYYVNGAYPLFEEGWGATSDGIILNANDFVDVAMYTDWEFFSSDTAGFNYFVTSESDPGDFENTFDYTAEAGKPLTVQVVRGMGNVYGGAGTEYTASENLCVHYGSSVDVNDSSDLYLSGGKAQITFNEPGSYYVWVDGTTVSCPAVANVTVTGSAVPENNIPTLVAGVPAAAEASIEKGQTYTLDLSTIFTDADGDALKYKYSYNGSEDLYGDGIEGSVFTETPVEAGTYTFKFMADDGKADSVDTYTVTLTVTEPAVTTAQKFAYEGTEVNFIKEDGSQFGMFTPQEETAIRKVGEQIRVTYYPKNTTVYAGVYLNADIKDDTTWNEDYYIPANSDGNYEFTLSEEYAGYAWPVAVVKPDKTSTTSAQYYLAIPKDIPMEYAILDGADASVEKGKPLTIRCDAALDKFVGFSVDGTALTKDTHFTLSEGSTVVTLNESYTNSLTAGAHNYAFAFSDGSAAGSFTVTEAANTAPALAEGVEAAAAATIELGKAYELDLTKIFTDADGDALTYKVKIGDADAVAANASYSYTPAEAGTYTLAFTANDGTADSPAYTVTLTVQGKPPVPADSTEIWNYNGDEGAWAAYSGIYMKSLAVSGVKVASFEWKDDTCEVVLDESTANNAEFNLDGVCNYTAGTRGISFNEQTPEKAAESSLTITLVDGKASATVQPYYSSSRKGTLKTISFSVKAAEQQPVQKFAYTGDTLTFIKDDGSAFSMYAPQEGTSISKKGDKISITYYPKNKTTYKGFYLDADVLLDKTWNSEKFFEADADGNYTFTLSSDYAGYAWPVAVIKKADGKPASQFYLAIPANIPTEYDILEGSGATVKQGETLAIRADADLEKFVSISVDGTALTKDTDYTLSEGSTVVTLAADYTAKLAEGKHAFALTFNDGSASGDFTVEKAAEPDLNTQEIKANYIDSIVITGAKVKSFTVDGTTYNVVLEGPIADGTEVTATFTTTDGARLHYNTTTPARLPQPQIAGQVWSQQMSPELAVTAGISNGEGTTGVACYPTNMYAFAGGPQPIIHTVNYSVYTAPRTTTTVYTTMIRQGAIQEGKDGTVLANIPVTVEGTENITVEDIVRQLHVLYHPDGAQGYGQPATATDGSGVACETFWGKGERYGYNVILNGASSNKNAVVDEGQDLEVFTWSSDTAAHSAADYIAKFDQTRLEAAGGAEVALTLSVGRPSWNEDYAAAANMPITIDGKDTGKKTGADGKVSLYFGKAGTYLVSIADDNTTDTKKYVPAYCTVTVTSDDAVEDVLAADAAALTLPESTKANLTLPAEGASKKTTITWATNNAAAITDAGVVTQAEEEQTAVLTATLSYGGATKTVEFTVTVPSNLGAAELEKAVLALQNGDPLEPSQWNGEGKKATAKLDTNIITFAQAIVDKAAEGVTVEEAVVSTDYLVISADGTINYDYDKETTADVTFTLKAGDESQQVTVTVNVEQGLYSKQEIMDKCAAGIKEHILGDNESLDKVTSNLTNLGNGVSAGDTYVQCTSTLAEESPYLESSVSGNQRVTRGTIHRPAYGEEDATVEIILNLSWYAFMEQYMPSDYVGPNPKAQQIIVPVTILAYTEEEMAAAKEAVDATIEALNLTTLITDFNTREAVDVNAVKGDLMLAAVEGYTSTTVWTSSNEDAVKSPSYKTGKAAVTRDEIGGEDKTATLTVTITKDGYSASKSIDVVVKPWTQEDIDAEQARIDAVAADFGFNTFRKDNVVQTKVTTDMLRIYRAEYDDKTKEITYKTSNSGNGFPITMTSSNTGVVSNYMRVTRPNGSTDAEVTITAVIKSNTMADRTEARTVVIPITVLAKDTLVDLNNAPVLADKSSAEDEAFVGKAYTLDLSTIFTELDGDEMTYTVKIGEEEAAAAEEKYSFSPADVGEYTLVFTASDGKLVSEEYTLKLTAKEVPGTDPTTYWDYKVDGTGWFAWGSGWNYVQTVFTEGVSVESYEWDGNTCNILLVPKTTKDAGFTLKTTSYARVGGIRVNGANAGTSSSATAIRLDNGAASVTVQPYYSSRIGTLKTFNFTIDGGGVDAYYAMTLPEGTGYTAEAAGESASPVLAGGSYSFKVNISEGYKKGQTFTVKANGTALTPDAEGIYTISDIHADQEITVEDVVTEDTVFYWRVALPTGTGYTTQAEEGFESPAAEGTDFSFKVNISEGYAKNASFSVKANDVELTADENDVYTIKNIQDHQTVTVTGVQDIYDVTLVSGTGYTVNAEGESASPVFSGGSFTYTVDIAEGYKQGADFAVKVNGTIVKPNDAGVYTISNIRAAQTVTVEDVVTEATVLQYRVTLPTVNGAVIAPVKGYKSPVDEGKDFKFTVTLEEGYLKADNYVVTANGKELKADKNGVYVIEDIHDHYNVVVAGVFKPAAIIAPAGSTITVGYQSGYFRKYWIDPIRVETLEDGRVQNLYNPISNNQLFWRVQNPDGVTYFDYTKTSLAAGDVVEVTPAQLFIGDDSYTKSTTIGIEGNLADVYLPINKEGYLNLEPGQEFIMNCFRNWLPVFDVINNNKEGIPDFHYEAVNFDGTPSDLVTFEMDQYNPGVVTMKAGSGTGTAIVKVTYDAMYIADTRTRTYGPKFGAIWPERTGVFVVSVGEDGTAIKTNMTVGDVSGGSHALDAEHDPLFYTGSEGAKVTFTPDEGSTVTVARPTVGDTLTFNGFTSDGVSVAEDGSVTVTGLVTGRNIIRVEKDGVAAYQVITAKEVTYTMLNASRDEVTADDTFNPGDKLTIIYSGLTSPAEKFSGKYNFNFRVGMKGEDGTQFSEASPGGYGVYNFTTKTHELTVTIPANWEGSSYTLTGNILRAGFGGGDGTHRTNTYGAGGSMAHGTAPSANLASMPELTLKVQAPPRLKDGVKTETEAKAFVGETYTLKLSDIFVDDNDDPVTYTVKTGDEEAVETEETYSFTPEEAGEYTFVFGASDEYAASKDTYTVKLTVPEGTDPTTLWSGNGWNAVNDSFMRITLVEAVGVTVKSYEWDGTTCNVVLAPSTRKEQAFDLHITWTGTGGVYVDGAGKTAKDFTVPMELANGEASVTVQPYWMSSSRGTTKTFNFTVEGGGQETVYNVNLASGTGYTLSAVGESANPVANKGSYTFALEIAEGYKKGADFAVKVNGEAVTLDENNQYTITNITSDKEVTVDDVVTEDTLNKYNVTLTETEGVVYTVQEGYSSPVDEGKDYRFTVSLNTGYMKGAAFAVQDNGTAMTADEEGVYALTEIAAHHTITVTGVTHLASVTAPTGSTVTAGSISVSFAYTWYDPALTDEKEDGTTIYYFNPISGTTFFRVQHPDGVTYWDFQNITAGSAYTVTLDDMTKNGTFASDTVYHDFYYNYLDLADIYLNINEKNYLSLAQGGTRVMSAFRNWQAIESFTNAKIAIPDVHYEVVDINGNPSDLVTVTPDKHNTGYATIKAGTGTGMAIIKITYDAMIHKQGYASGYGAGGADSTRLSAIWPECTGIIVVTVGEDGSAINMGMTINTDGPIAHAGKVAGNNIDAEHDLLYYYGDEGASYNFKPESGTTVSIARSTVGEKELYYNGFTTDGVITEEDGSVTVTGLTAGRHIVKVEKGGVANYQVISARQITITATDGNGNAVDWENTIFTPGDVVNLKLHNVNSPQEKFATCYNNSFSIAYFGEDAPTTRLPGTNDGTHGYGQYNFSSIDQVITVTIPEEWTTKKTYSITHGAVAMAGFSGTAAGGHRSKSYGVASGMAQGTSGAGVLAKLPDLVLQVNAQPYVIEGLTNPVTASVAAGEAYALDLSKIFADGNDDVLTYTVQIDGAAAAAADAEYTFTPAKAGVYTLVFTANDGLQDSKDTYTVVLKVDQENALPTLREGTEAKVEAQAAGEAYELDLDSIFTDADGDYLTYKVSVNGADAKAAAAQYVFEGNSGTYTLVFTANDGTADSEDTYTVKLTVIAGMDPGVYWDYTKDGNGWLGRTTSYCYVQTVSSSGVRVKDFEWTDAATCNIVLVPETAADAAFDFTVTNYVRSSGTNGVKINGTDSNGASRTVQIAMTDGKASVTVQPYGYRNTYLGTLKTFNFTVEANTAPVLAEGVTPQAAVSVNCGGTYALDLSAIFTDAENENLNYTVTAEGAEAEETFAKWTFNAAECEEDTATFVFNANDGILDAQSTYTLTLMITHNWGEPEWTWNGCKEAEAAFVCADNEEHTKNAEAAITAEVQEDGTVVYTAEAIVDGQAYSDTKTKAAAEASVDFTSQMSGGFLHAPQTAVKVASSKAESYGYSDTEVEGVSVLDVLVAAHELVFGEDFTKESAEEYLVMGASGTPMTMFGVEGNPRAYYEASNMGMFMLNHGWPNDGTIVDDRGAYKGTTFTSQQVKDGDLVEFFYNESGYLTDTYTWFTDADGEYSRSFTTHVGEGLDLVLCGAWIPDPVQFTKDEMDLVNFERIQDDLDAVQLYLVDTETGALTEIEDTFTDFGEVTLDIEEPGTYTITAYTDEDDMNVYIMTLTTVTVTGHDLTKTDEVPADCEYAGTKAYWTCGTCGKLFSDAAGTKEIKAPEAIPATGHDWGVVSYRWADDNSAVTAMRTCKNDPSHVEEETAEATAEVTKEATCEEKGETTYTSAAFENEAFEAQTKTVANIDALNHDWEVVSYEWADDYSTVTGTLKCANDGEHLYTETVETTSEKIKDPTCEEKGETKYTAAFTHKKLAILEKSVYDVPALGHTLVKTDEVPASCEETGVAAYRTCSVCGKMFADAEGTVKITEPEVLPATGHSLVKTEAADPTCEEAGNSEYYTCSACGKFFSDAEGKTEIEKDSWVIEALGHKLTKTEAVEAKCETDGNSEYYTCSVCGKFFSDAEGKTEIEKDSWIIEALGHKLTKTEAVEAKCETDGNSEYYTCSACGKFFSDAEGKTEIEKDSWIIAAIGHEWDEGVITRQPTKTEEGEKLFTCKHDSTHTKTESVPYTAVTKLTLDKETAEVATKATLQLNATLTPAEASDQTITWTSSDASIASVDANGLVKAKKYGKVTITATSADGQSATCEIQTRFYDVNNPSKSYWTPVYWAVDNGITKTTVNFNPDDGLTRGEFVAFMYRLEKLKNGTPKTKASSKTFSDVTSDTKFSKEIYWAVGEGIIKGYKDGTFRPDVVVTRAQAALMLCRWAGSPKAKAKTSPFSDVTNPKAESYNAILWGNENGIMKGSGGKFLPNDDCSRANIVTFLYRYNQKF